MADVDRGRTVVDGLIFPEAPRWRDGALWYSDFFLHEVRNLGADGGSETVATVEAQPSGLGWTPDGRLLVVSMIDRRLLRLDPDGLTEVADLKALTQFHANDMVVDRQGRAYVGNCGFDYLSGETPRPTGLVLVEPNGAARVVADGLMFPNGSVITPDGKTLVVAETFAARLTAFSIAGDGSLSDRRVWAMLEGETPDGVCLDAEGAIWVASPMSGAVLRVREGGEISERLKLADNPTACVLGGEDGRTLFVTVSRIGSVEPGAGRIEGFDVAVPGA